MNNLVNLMLMVGQAKTLIIACGEYGLSNHIDFNDRIFIYSLSESMLQRHDPLEKGCIQHYIEGRECKQVVIVSSIEQHLVHRLIRDESVQSPAASLKFNLKVFLKNQDKEILSDPLRNRILVEQHIIGQCNLVMGYYFVRERVENKKLQIRGFVIEQPDENPNAIFQNGIIYNDSISMN